MTTVLENEYIPHDPTPLQAKFLLSDELEVLFGGAVGGGKSDALLMAALQYVHVTGYAALLLRRSYADLSLPGAIMERSFHWLNHTNAKWKDKEKTWAFPDGATVTFGYLDTEKDKYRYQSSEFQFIGFDELTQFSITMYKYLFSRLRRLEGSVIPIRMRSGTNPDGVGLEWVRSHFIDAISRDQSTVFIPAKLEDNPFVDMEEYDKALNKLDATTRERLRHGNWNVQPEGQKFKRGWFEIVDDFPHDCKQVRFWDMAATDEPKSKDIKSDPDYTVGCRMGEKDGVFYVIDIQRERGTPLKIERLIRQTAEIDGVKIKQAIEQEPGSAGVNVIDHYAREVLKGFDFKGVRSTGDKEVRANPLSAAAEKGNVKIVRGEWNSVYLDEICAFPTPGVHDDQVDGSSGAFNRLAPTDSYGGLLEFYKRRMEQNANT